MTQKEVIRKLIDSIANEMRLFDFEPSFKEQGFIRRTNEAIFFYQLLIYNRTFIKSATKGFLIEPYIWIGIKEIERYYKEITVNTELKNEVSFITLGNSIADLLANPDGIYKKRNMSLELHVFAEKDIQSVAALLLKQFKEIALSYCLGNANVGMADKLINNKPEDYKVHVPNDNYRILKGVIAARLNNNSSLDELIKKYERQLIERDMLDDTKTEMNKLKTVVQTMGTNSSV